MRLATPAMTRFPLPGVHLDPGTTPSLVGSSPFSLATELPRRVRALMAALSHPGATHRVHVPAVDGTWTTRRTDEVLHLHLGATGVTSPAGLWHGLRGEAVVHLHATNAVPLRHGTPGHLRQRLVDATVESRLLSRAPLVLAASHRLAEVAHDAGATHVVVLPPAPMPVAVTTATTVVAGRVVVAGPVGRSRRIGLVAEALRGVQGAELVLVGTGPDVDGVLASARVAAVPCTHLTRPTWQTLTDLLASAEVVVAPGVTGEHLSVPLLAMSLGRPVLASAVEGLPDVISDGLDGVLVSPTDPNALREALVGLLGDPERAAAIGRAAARRTAAGWSARAARVELLLAGGVHAAG